jgi:hypothetical protein
MNDTKQLINDGGPAFPVADTTHWDGQIQYGSNGMTLRDYFAGQALAGFCAVPDRYNWLCDDAAFAYKIADAMLAARERKEDAK